MVVFTLAIWFLLGLVAAFAGGDSTKLGTGPSGGWGIPDLILTFAMLLALPSFVIGFGDLFRKRAGAGVRMLAYAFPRLISVAYFVIAHIFDPCLNGIWTSFSHVGSAALCEWSGSDLNVHTRFHLLWHVLPTLPLVLLYWLFIERRYPIASSVAM